TGSAGGRIERVSDIELDIGGLEAPRIGRDHGDAGARAGPDVLRAHLDIDRAIGMDGEIAIAGVAASTPGVKREPHPARDISGNVLSARMPLFLPAHHFCGERELVAIDLR